jgi:hypothetical protein
MVDEAVRGEPVSIILSRAATDLGGANRHKVLLFSRNFGNRNASYSITRMTIACISLRLSRISCSMSDILVHENTHNSRLLREIRARSCFFRRKTWHRYYRTLFYQTGSAPFRP